MGNRHFWLLCHILIVLTDPTASGSSSGGMVVKQEADLMALSRILNQSI